MKPKVSCIVSAYRATAGELLDRLENLFTQTYESIEVILVLNDSSSEIKHVVKNMMNQEPTRFRVLSTKREGIYASWNRGIRIAHGDYVTNANIDDRLFPDGLEKLVKGIESSGAGLVYGESIVVGEIPAAIITPKNAEFIQTTRYPYIGGVLGLEDFDLKTLMRRHCIGNMPLWRLDLHTKHGWFDEAMQLAGDYEWALRLQSRGVSFYYVKDSVGTFYYGRNATTLHQAQSDYEAILARLRWQKELNGRAGFAQSGRV